MSDLKDNVKVAIRIRPLNEKEQLENCTKCISILESKTILLESRPEPRSFKYDNVSTEQSTQEEIFEIVGKPITTSCMRGYNGTIFAYGQTGAGKTFTIQGAGYDEFSLKTKLNYHLRGILPRCFEFLFASIVEETTKKKSEYLVKCSFLEIYQESINDLLDPAPRNLQLREDMKKGVYVEGLIEETVKSAIETYELLNIGTQNRHVSGTSMNKESSRSHSVFTLIIESKNNVDGLVNFKTSRFHLIDLAGSERQKATDCAGERLKEAGMINKSLSALGNVINSLVDISEGKSRHVHYRDSKLTFLLKDSLGGNSKTFIIANISPASSAFAETLSTLKFAQRAKMIKNSAVVNEDITGTVNLLKYEIKKLKDELALQKSLSGESSNFCSKCNSTLSKNFDLLNLVEIVKDLELLLESNTKLRVSAEKQLQQELSDKEEVIKVLKTALTKVESKANHDKMVLKFRDATIAKMQVGVDTAEVESLKKENASLREQVENNPLAAQLFVENRKLKVENEQLRKECKVDSESWNGRIREGHDYTERLCEALKMIAEEKGKIGEWIRKLDVDNEELKNGMNRIRTEFEVKVKGLERENGNLNSRVRALMSSKSKGDFFGDEENLLKSAEIIQDFFQDNETSGFVQKLQKENEFLKRRVEELDKIIEEKNKKITELEENFRKVQEELQFSIELSETKENQLKQSQQDIENLTETCEFLKSQSESLTITLLNKEEEHSEQSQTIQRLETHLSQLLNSINSSQDLISNCETLTNKIETLEKQIKTLEKTLKTLTSEKTKFETLYENSLLQSAAEKKNVSMLYEKLSTTLNELKESQQTLQEFQDKIESLEEDKAKLLETCAAFDDITENLERNKQEKEELEKKLKNECEKFDQVEKDLKEKAESLESIQREKVLMDDKLTEGEKMIQGLRDECLNSVLAIAALKQMNEELEKIVEKWEIKGEDKERVLSELQEEVIGLKVQKKQIEGIAEKHSTECSVSNERFVELGEKLEVLQNTHSRVFEKLVREKEKKQKLAKQTIECSSELQSVKSDVETLRLKLEQAEQKRNIFNEQIKTSEKILEKLKNELENEKNQRIATEKVLVEVQNDKKDLQVLVLNNSEVIQSLHSKILQEESALKSEMDSKNEKNSLLIEKTKELKLLESKLSSLTEEKEEILQINQAILLEKDELSKFCEHNQESIKDLQKCLENERTCIEENILQRLAAEEKIQTLEITTKTLHESLQTTSNLLSASQKTVQTLSESLEIHKSSQLSFKTALKALQIIPDIETLSAADLSTTLQTLINKNELKLPLSLIETQETFIEKTKILENICEKLEIGQMDIQSLPQRIQDLNFKQQELVQINQNLTESLQKESKRAELLTKETEVLKQKITKSSVETNKELKLLEEEIFNLQSRLETSKANQQFEYLNEENILLKSQILDSQELKEKLENEILKSKEEIETLKEENKNKMEILKNTNKNILSTRNEINMWKKCIDDKNLLIQELRDELRKKEEEIIRKDSEGKNRTRSRKQSFDHEEPEIRHLNQIIQIKDKELKELKEKGQEYYTQADEALESQRKEMEIFAKRITALQSETKRLKEELRLSLKDRETMLEDIKRLKSEEFRNHKEKEDAKKMITQLREDKTKLLIELTNENERFSEPNPKNQEKIIQENSVLKAQLEKTSQELASLRDIRDLSRRDLGDKSVRIESEKQNEEIRRLASSLSKLTDAIFALPGASLHPEETSIVDGAIRVVRGLAEQLQEAEKNKGEKSGGKFKSQLAQYYTLVNKRQ